MKNKAFTLIEVLVVATIIALLAAAGALSYTSLNRGSRDARRKADLEEIRAAFEQWRSDYGSYPTSLIIDCADRSLISGTYVYLQKVPKDPQCTTRTYKGVISESDYTLGAGLEMGGTACLAANDCGSGVNCTYCVGPYGQK